MFPYFDENPRQRIPYFTFFLITVNIILFFALNFRPDFKDIVFRFGFIPQQFSFLTIFTSIFLHANIFHLAGNMWFLWLFGDNIEDKIGTGLFFLLYLLGGIFASLAHVLFSSAAMREIPCIGASGAISAIMGTYFVLFPKAKIRALVSIHYMVRTIRINAFVFLGFWALLQFIFGATNYEGAATTGVAYGVHVGGFFFGVMAGFIFRNLLFSPDIFLLPQELKKEEDKKEFDQIIQKAIEVKKEKAKDLKEFDEEIGRFLDQGNIQKAIESYKLFERYSIPGALRPQYQGRIADILNERNQNLLALQAYLRLISQYFDHTCSAIALCRVGLLYSKDFKDPAEGIQYLNKGLKRAKDISDQVLLAEVRKEIARINKALDETFLDQPASSKKGELYCILAQLFDETLWNSDKIVATLRSIGMKGGRNRGMKLAYNAEYNLRKKDGVILQKIEKDEAIEAAKLIQSMDIPVIAIPQKTLLEYPFIQGVRKVTLQEGELSLVTERGKSHKISVSDIRYICLAQIPYFIYGIARNEDSQKAIDMSEVMDFWAAKNTLGTWTYLATKGTKTGKIKDLQFNRILDIFTASGLRLRINNFRFKYETKNVLEVSKDELFSLLVEDIASFAGGDKIDENVKLFISTSKWASTHYRNIQELNVKGLWRLRLCSLYSRLFS